MSSVVLRLVDWCTSPAGRFRSDGPFSGEAYREDVLLPALAVFDLVTVDLDGGFGFGSSFLEEAFGGLIRSGRFTKETLRSKLVIRSSMKTYVARATSYMEDAWRRS